MDAVQQQIDIESISASEVKDVETIDKGKSTIRRDNSEESENEVQ